MPRQKQIRFEAIEGGRYRYCPKTPQKAIRNSLKQMKTQQEVKINTHAQSQPDENYRATKWKI